MHKLLAVLTCVIFLSMVFPVNNQVKGLQPIPPPPLPTFGFMAVNFDTNTFLIAGNNAYCTDVLGSARIAFGLARGGSTQNPEGRTDTLLTQDEFDTGNLIPVGGPAINQVTDQFNFAFGVEYTYIPGTSFDIQVLGQTMTLDLNKYPHEDICLVYLRELNGRNILLVWGYGWQGTYAGSTFMGDPGNWQTYHDDNMLMLRWTDADGDGLVQVDEITVEHFE